MPDKQKVDATSKGEAATQVDGSNAPTPDSSSPDSPAPEFGGRKSGLDPIRYGDWEMNGRCIDF